MTPPPAGGRGERPLRARPLKAARPQRADRAEPTSTTRATTTGRNASVGATKGAAAKRSTSTKRVTPSSGRATGQRVWVTLREASESAGVSISALRKWYNAGIIPSKMAPGPRGDQRLVPLDAVHARAAKYAHAPLRDAAPEPPPPPAPVAPAAPTGIMRSGGAEELVVILDRLADAERRAARAETALEVAKREIAVLRVRVAQMEGALRGQGLDPRG